MENYLMQPFALREMTFMRLLRFLCVLCICTSLCACAPNYTGEIPNLKFTPTEKTQDGKPCFYLFDDNPEHLHKDFLADGEIPSSIAHFEALKPGVYTIFSYHHRGDSAESDTDLFFDVLFRSTQPSEYKITKMGLDHNWQWNKAWADFSGVDVYAPEYLKSFDCTCEKCKCGEPDGVCPDTACPCTVRDEFFKSDSLHYDDLNHSITAASSDKQLLSEVIPKIKEERINEIRHGSYNEPIWLMMEFEIISGEMTIDTVAYTDLEKAKASFDTMLGGRVEKEPQFKGMAENAPVVTAELNYIFDDTTKKGALPVRIFNQRYPEGYVAKDGSFGTNVNTWKVKELIAAESAESDMMRLTYHDRAKLNLYGNTVTDKNDIWHFDPFHTSLYAESGNPDFVPNIPMSQVDYPSGGEKIPHEFYSKYVCNLGNFGVRYLYTFNLKNYSSEEKTFCFSINSLSGQVYRYSLVSDGKTIRDDGGRYIMKRFDADPAEDPKSTSEPKARLEPNKYTTTERFALQPNSEYTLSFEVVTLTGCDAPMTNTVSVE